jgi:hypothetical protein
MRRKSYPLDPLVRVREGKVDTAMTELSAAVRAREDAESARLAVEAERARQGELARGVREAEARALGGGELSAADLQRQGAWDARMQWEAEERARVLAAAVDAEARAHGGEQKARGEVGKREADARVVTQHKERWVAEAERKAEAAAEEGAVEAWRPRR